MDRLGGSGFERHDVFCAAMYKLNALPPTAHKFPACHPIVELPKHICIQVSSSPKSQHNMQVYYKSLIILVAALIANAALAQPETSAEGKFYFLDLCVYHPCS